ncbi:MAG: hypothetical protein OER86_00675 [Phycisphaerae bacterium]|nr:hypothetical protein [Phycisphaerae bacterium]
MNRQEHLVSMGERLDRLERRVGCYQRILVAAGVLILATLVLGQRPVTRTAAGGVLPVVRARKLQIYNERNEVVFLVGAEKGTGKGTWQLIHERKAVASCFPGKWGGSIQLSPQGGEKTGLLLVGNRGGYGSAVVWGDSQSIKWQAP